MELNVSGWLFNQWQRKLIALFVAVFIWVLVNNSITDVKTISNIAVRVINLPADKAITGLLSNGLLSRRATLTLSGTKDVIGDLEASDIEVVLDAVSVDNNEWVVDISKKNLVSLNPSVNLSRHITQVEHGDFVIQLSRLTAAKVPVTILPPTGEAPLGYTFIDIWPQHLLQTITGPQDEVAWIQSKGLQLQIDLSQITTADLHNKREIKTPLGDENSDDNEIIVFIPAKWKKITVPYREEPSEEELNDPNAKYLHMTFLKEQWLSLKNKIPIAVYYPVNTLESLNPKKYPLATGDKIEMEHGTTLLNMHPYLYGVSRFFMETIQDSLQISVVAATPSEGNALLWSAGIIDPIKLENTYVTTLLAKEKSTYGALGEGRFREKALRQRFKIYLDNLAFYEHQDQKLYLECFLEPNKIQVK